MNNSAWDFLYHYFSAQEAAYQKIITLCKSHQATTVDDDEQDVLPEEVMVTHNPDLLPIHQEMLKNIQQCQQNLTPLMAEKELIYLIRALIFHCDETVLTTTIIHKLLQRNRSLWPVLQQQLAQCRNGGECFFNHLDELLLHCNTYRMALEVYYFCLKQGFKGCYFNDPEKIKIYLSRCTRAIRQNAMLTNLTHPRFSPSGYGVSLANAGNRLIQGAQHETIA